MQEKHLDYNFVFAVIVLQRTLILFFKHNKECLNRWKFILNGKIINCYNNKKKNCVFCRDGVITSADGTNFNVSIEKNE